jgi:CBS domain-containing protein
MKVEEIMTRDVKTCRLQDTLNAAACLLWEADCGCAPVVDAESRVIGMITDRDICMSAYFRDRPLSTLLVSDAMSVQVFSCVPGDSVEQAEQTMRERQVRRLPVTDESGRIVGILSLNDIAREAENGRIGRKRKSVKPTAVAATLAAVGEPHSPPPAAMVT